MVSRGKDNSRNHDSSEGRNGKTNSCNICGNQITATTSLGTADSRGLCTSCYTGFEEMMRAVGALHYEMATAYGIDPNNIEECSRKLPGIAVEEIAIRMELNRLKASSH